MSNLTADTNERLAHEIRCARTGLWSAIHTRKAHPTYGYTKADLRERLARLEGMLFAWAVHDDPEGGHASVAMSAASAAIALDIDLQRLQERVEAA